MTPEKKTSPFRTDPETGKPWSEVHKTGPSALTKATEIKATEDVDLQPSYAGVNDLSVQSATEAVATTGNYIAKATQFVAPLAVEIGAPIGYAIAASPLLIAPVPGSRVAYFAGLGAVGSGSNAIAQAMRIGYGDQDEWSWEENIAATALSVVPGVKSTKDLSKAATVALRAGEGAVMATGETATRQALEMGSGKRTAGDWDKGELAGAAAFGSVLGGVLGRLEKAMMKATPKEMANPMLRRALRDELKIAKKLLKENKGEEDLVKAGQTRIDDIEKQIQDLAAPEEKILQKAIDHLDEVEADQIKAHHEAALDFQKSDVAKRLQESDDRQWGPKTDVALPPVEERLPNRLRRAAPRYNVGKKNYGLEFDNDVDKALFIVRNRKNKSKADGDYMDFLRKVLAGKTDDEIRSLGDRISNELIKPEAMTGSGGTKLNVPRFHGVAEALDLPQSTKVETSAVIDPKETTPGGPVIDPRKTEGTGDIVDARGRKIPDDFMSGEEPTGEIPLGLKAEAPAITPALQKRMRAALDEIGTRPKDATEGAELDSLGDELFRVPEGTMQFWRKGNTLVWKNRKTGEFTKVFQGKGAEKISAKYDELMAHAPELFLETQFVPIRNEAGDVVTYAATQRPIKESLDLYKKVTPKDATLLEKLRKQNPLFEKYLVENDIGGKNVGLVVEGDKVYARAFDVDELADNTLTTEVLKSLEGRKMDGVDLADFSADLQKQIVQGAHVDPRGRKILDDFMSGEGTRDIDAETGKPKDSKDEIKARLLSSDEDVQRLINVTQDAIVDDLKNIKGRQSKLQYLGRVQEELNRRIGGDVANEFGIVLKAAQLADDMEVANALDKLTIHMGANAMTLTSRLADIPKMLQDADLDDPAVVNNALVAIARTINPILANKRGGSASGRLLQSRQVTKDAIEVEYKKIEEAMEERLVSELKTSDKLTPEQLKQQVDTFGDIQIVKRLLKAVQQAEDVREVKKILMDQQQAFQNQTTFGKFMSDNVSRYVKVRDVMTDALYSSMLSSPITPIKAAIGNAIMTRYHPFMGRVGAKFMALVPWARRGMTKQQWEDAGAFWKKVGMSYSHFNDLALQEAKRAFKSGDADFRSHFERIGGSALAMERTGLSGALGQSLENAGQFVDIPGKTLASIDARTKTRVAHSMTAAKAHHDYTIAKRKDPDSVPDSFDEYYQNFLQKVFNEDGNKLMTEDQVRRQAVIAAEAEGVAPEKLGDYIENYVKTRWDKSTSDFVSYVERNAKEITFQEELGEFTKANVGEKGLKKLESIIRSSPILQVTLFPFMRTGRNIIREGLSTTSILADTPWIGQYIDGMWSKTTQDLNSGDPIVMARARGRQVVGAGIISSMIALAKSGVLVGNEEQNWKKKENLNVGTGLGDYEVRLPLGPKGETVGISYTALEPFATVAGIVADGVKLMEDGKGEQELLGSTLIHAAQTVVSNNIGNKSYFKNLGTALKLITITSESESATTAQRSRMINSFTSPLVPSGMNALEMVTDNERRRGDHWLQVVGKRIVGIAKAVPPYRDMFGDVIPRHGTDFTGEPSAAQGFTLFNPFEFRKQRMNVDNYVKEDKNGFRTIDVGKINLKDVEAVRNAAWAIAIEVDGEYQFNGGTTVKDGVELRNIVHEETGVDAFERWQQIYQTVKVEGKNVKQAIVATAKDYDFRKRGKLPPNKIPKGVQLPDLRKTTINATLGGFRNAAWNELLKEYPLLQEIKEDSIKRQEALYESFNVEKALDQSKRQAPLEAYEEEGRPPTRLQQLINPINLINNN